MAAVMQVTGLRCGYRGTPVIRDVSFTVGGGDFLGIIGPNGAGKTTLFRAMTNILAPDSGGVRLNGTPIAALGARALAKQVAVLPQSVETAFSFTVGEFVRLGRFPHGGRFGNPGARDERVVDEALDMTDVAGLRDNIIGELSGGERQRALVAQAVVQEPELFLLDEPTAHLDIGHATAVMDLLARLNRERGVTVCVVLHDLNQASEYCERLILLSEGRIHTEGAPKEVLTYQHIEDVYKTVVVVNDNPISKRPHVLTVRQDAR